MKFHLFADTTFEAEDIVDAFEKLSKHFGSLVGDEPTELLDHRGTFDIRPVEDIEKDL